MKKGELFIPSPQTVSKKAPERKKRIMQLSETQRADIYALAKSGVDIEVIARDYHLSHTDIYRVLKAEPKKYTRFFKGQRREEILEEYAKGTDIYELSRLFRTSTSTLKKHLINEGVYRKEEEKRQTEILPLEKENDFIERYKEGESLEQLMIEYGCYQTTLEKIILKHPELKRKRRVEIAIQSKINRRYEIECETEEEAEKLKDAIIHAERLLRERETITIEKANQMVIVQGEVSYLFHNVMLRYFIDEEE